MNHIEIGKLCFSVRMTLCVCREKYNEGSNRGTDKAQYLTIIIY